MLRIATSHAGRHERANWALGYPITVRAARLPTVTTSKVPGQTKGDAPLRRAQATPGDMSGPLGPSVTPLPPGGARLPTITMPTAGGQSISLQTALYGALTSNPDLVTLRQGNVIAVSAEAVEVARHFPTTLNPTLWMDYRPITLVPNGTFGTKSPGGPPLAKTAFIISDRIIFTSPYASRSNWGIRPRTATTLPRQLMTSSGGLSFRPSCWALSRPIGSSKPLPTAARSTAWPSNWPTLTTTFYNPFKGGWRPIRSWPLMSRWHGSRAGQHGSKSRRLDRIISRP